MRRPVRGLECQKPFKSQSEQPACDIPGCHPKFFGQYRDEGCEDAKTKGILGFHGSSRRLFEVKGAMKTMK